MVRPLVTPLPLMPPVRTPASPVTLSNPPALSAAVGTYLPPGRITPVPMIVTHLELSGYAQDPTNRQWFPLRRVQLNPAQTTLEARCNCPIDWQIQPV